jgi:hypothetical protein
MVGEIWAQVTDNKELMINIAGNIQPLHTVCNRRNKNRLIERIPGNVL